MIANPVKAMQPHSCHGPKEAPARRRFITTFLAAAGLLLALPAMAAEPMVLNVYNWSDYIAPGVIAKFEVETGISVNYDVFDANELLEARLLAGASGYDIVVPSASFLARQIEIGLFQPLNKSVLPNLKNLDPALMDAVAAADPGNQYGVIYMWGTTGFGYNPAEISQRLPDAPLASWDMIFDPEIVAKFADCGVALLDDPGEVMAAALIYLERDANSSDPADLKAAEALLAAIRPFVRYFGSSRYIADLANGEICLAQGYSGDILQARDRAAEAQNGINVAYVIPSEGAVIWFDLLAVPADAPHPQNALAFIDFLLRPEIAAENTNAVFFANANAASIDYIDPEITADPAIYPPSATASSLNALVARPLPVERLVTRAFIRIKSGR
jgi:putrescine transport system substrate-binding protein